MSIDERVVPGQTHPKYVAEHVARYFFAQPFCRDKVVLDAACGVGYGSKIIAEVARSVIGWDNSIEAYEMARESYSGPTIAYQKMDVTKATIPKEVEVVVSFETLEHVDNPEVFTEQVFKKAQTFIFSLPLRCPSPYHKKVFASFDEVKKLMGDRNIDWYGQKLWEGDFFISQPATNDHFYIIGVWKR